MPVVLVVEEIGFEQGVVNEGLEDRREEARLGQIEQRAHTWFIALATL